eukprot:GHVS01074424.1.p3 GENE.GHVS01074424.1~~GHVS01074424.1.p3  ORF type:complete len:139 (-),score=19.23 GHVS01074424.1:84-500(-)
MSTFHRPNIPAVGFALGDEVMMKLLSSKNATDTKRRPAEITVWPMGEQMYGEAVRVATRLRQAGRSTQLVLQMRAKARKIFGQSSEDGAKAVVIVGSDEWGELGSHGKVSVKRLSDGQQRTCAAESIADFVKAFVPAQ